MTLLIALIAAFLVLLLGFAAYISYEAHHRVCAPGVADCGAPPGTPR
jgi:hypothetical protein